MGKERSVLSKNGRTKRLSFIIVQSDVEYLPVTAGDADVAALVVLVAIVPTDVVHLSLSVDAHFIDTGNAFAGALENG